MLKGHLYVISAPSGAGKTSIVQQVVAEDQTLRVSISHTTRPIRPGEHDGINYHFVDQQKFTELLNQNAFLEHARVHNHYYGTAKSFVTQQLQAGFDVILEIDWQGAKQIRETFSQESNLVSVFILPPSFISLKNRMLQRAQDSEAIINQRLANAHEEILHYQEFDYLIINETFNEAVAELHAIIKAARLRCPYAAQLHRELIHGLLEH